MPVDLARYIVDAVVLEGRSYGEVAAAHGVAKSWVAKLVWRYRAGGYAAITPRSRAAHRVANRTPAEVEDQIVALRKHLTEAGFDAGAHTIAHHPTLIRSCGRPVKARIANRSMQTPARRRRACG